MITSSRGPGDKKHDSVGQQTDDSSEVVYAAYSQGMEPEFSSYEIGDIIFPQVDEIVENEGVYVDIEGVEKRGFIPREEVVEKPEVNLRAHMNDAGQDGRIFCQIINIDYDINRVTLTIKDREAKSIREAKHAAFEGSFEGGEMFETYLSDSEQEPFEDVADAFAEDFNKD